ncbi:MAG TPA: maleylacetoacetate isomerase [Xanthobacteraceae bacterium]|nr:maleylacetoacetate isomerase [Xanthobacteraceae bacterium]
MKLFTFFRSSAAYRARIALNLKGLSYDMTSIVFAKGDHLSPAYQAVNPQKRVPTLELDDGSRVYQSLAMMEYLDEVHPQPPFLPRDPFERAHARAIAQIVACDIHPLNNVGPLNYLRKQLGQSEDAINAWYHHWVLEGFEAIESLITPSPYAAGSAVTVADICLVPQIYNARRFKVPLDAFPKILAVEEACNAIEAFDRARPENQPDATA